MIAIDILYEDDRWRRLGLTPLAQHAIDAAAAHLGVADGFEVSVLACDDAKITRLNAEFRDKPTPTNVLSWPTEDRAALVPGEMPALPIQPDPMDSELGDIALSYDTCLQEARAQGKRPEDHICHLIVHGFLHLLGFDHIYEADAALMEGLEREILAKLGKPDPYRNEVGEDLVTERTDGR